MTEFQHLGIIICFVVFYGLLSIATVISLQGFRSKNSFLCESLNFRRKKKNNTLSQQYILRGTLKTVV